MSTPPAFQFYASDFESDEAVKLMTDEEIGVYVRLLCHAWREGGVPANFDQLARLLGRTRGEFDRVWPAIRSKWTRTGGRFVNPRMERERKKQADWRKKSAEGGRRGAASRWGKPRGGQRVVTPPPQPNDDSSSPSSTTSLEETNVGGTTSRSVSLNDSLVHNVVGRFEKAATTRPGLEVDPEGIARALHDFMDLIGLEGHAIHCAEYFGAEKKRDRRVAHLSLRTWLRKARKDEAREVPAQPGAVQADQAERNTAAMRDRTRFQPLLEEMFAWSEGAVIQGAKKLEAMGETPTARKVELLIGPSPLAQDVA